MSIYGHSYLPVYEHVIMPYAPLYSVVLCYGKRDHSTFVHTFCQTFIQICSIAYSKTHGAQHMGLLLAREKPKYLIRERDMTRR